MVVNSRLIVDQSQSLIQIDKENLASRLKESSIQDYFLNNRAILCYIDLNRMDKTYNREYMLDDC